LSGNVLNQDTINIEPFDTDESLYQRKGTCLNKKILIWIFPLLIAVIFIAFIFWNFVPTRKGEEQKPEAEASDNFIIIDEVYWYENEGKKDKKQFFQITQEGIYKVCVFGAKAMEGGRGGKQCATHFFKKGDFIDFYLEGRSSGGQGGKNCGWNHGNGYDGAGLAKAEKRNHSEEFLIVAGGGGGNSEDNINKGGDYEKDGEGTFKGGGATSLTYGKKGGENSEDGKIDKGGKGGSSGTTGSLCGGGGGNGYYGGGGGGYAYFKERVGGGGGGSNFCNGENCEKGINDIKVYAGYKITNLM